MELEGDLLEAGLLSSIEDWGGLLEQQIPLLVQLDNGYQQWHVPELDLGLIGLTSSNCEE